MLSFISIAINLLLSSAAINMIYNGHNVGLAVIGLIINMVMAIATFFAFVISGMSDE